MTRQITIPSTHTIVSIITNVQKNRTFYDSTIQKSYFTLLSKEVTKEVKYRGKKENET